MPDRAAKLRSYNAINHLPQATLARLLDLSMLTYNRLYNDKIAPRIDLVENIEKLTRGFVRARDWYAERENG